MDMGGLGDIGGTSDFQFARRFFCRELPDEFDDGDAPTLIVQSYFVHEDDYALRIRLQTRAVRVPMSAELDPKAVLERYRDDFREATLTVKGPSRGGTRYEAQRSIDSRVAAEIMLRGGDLIIKNRTSVWIGADGWNIDVFGGANVPLVIAEAERSTPVTNLIIPRFCITEITDQSRFSNDSLSWRPFSQWSSGFERELRETGPQFQQVFGTNTLE
ncbi:adenylate cyclase [Bifidobacterium pseudolongum subsp. globosum]|uniref:Adenylate cyclase n=1 Tax=Bifidobacterium pseudolongum subsp. globosum TaxID=1690 RepID=A0A4V1Y3L8_9BIFI|nr:adenylate cyclase [Bifidobacterium pseudolongum subsp. globosum]RYQ08760.1 adenylate cyclase [Bifidobacterium pseudolongum subsp. globosum]RYQ12554.1 adenylate cyclase [Bifidobacterium pseudolongum subsp. globosum]RYQ14849.1 adenylate cyclase [Bifidobacterium pseudolongum subsp. globosum]RYQ20718.1 adenylate cyclase [Bifidobacterium pseudolongum subsp. globosum]